MDLAVDEAGQERPRASGDQLVAHIPGPADECEVVTGPDLLQNGGAAGLYRPDVTAPLILIR
jgi:hypothetical protein